MGFSAEVEVQGFRAVRMGKQGGGSLALNRIDFSVEILFFSMALALVPAQVEILGCRAESLMVEQSARF